MFSLRVSGVGPRALLQSRNNSDISCISGIIVLLFYLCNLYHYYCNYFLLYHRPKSTKLNYKLNYIFPIICIIFYYITIIPIIVFYLHYGHYIELNLIISVKMNYIHYGNYINNFLIIISTSDIAFKSLINGSCSRR